MNEQKRVKMAAAVTVNIILLILILVAVVIYQLAEISVISARRTQMQKEYQEYVQMEQEKKSELEYLKSEQGMMDLAFQYGYHFPEE